MLIWVGFPWEEPGWAPMARGWGIFIHSAYGAAPHWRQEKPIVHLAWSFRPLILALPLLPGHTAHPEFAPRIALWTNALQGA